MGRGFVGWQLVPACPSRLGLGWSFVGACIPGIGTLQKWRPAIVAFPCIKLNSHWGDLHLPMIASIKYPSLMPLYIYSVSLETHKASFSDLCDETSLHYLPGTFWRNKRPIEQSFEMNKYEKGGNKRAGSSPEQRALFIWMLYMLYPVFPSGSPGKGEWDGKVITGPALWLPLLLPDFPLLPDLVPYSLPASQSPLPPKSQNLTAS